MQVIVFTVVWTAHGSDDDVGSGAIHHDFFVIDCLHVEVWSVVRLAPSQRHLLRDARFVLGLPETRLLLLDRIKLCRQDALSGRANAPKSRQHLRVPSGIHHVSLLDGSHGVVCLLGLFRGTADN